MKRIVLLIDAARINEKLVRRLWWLFPECEIEIVAVAEGGPADPVLPPPQATRSCSGDPGVGSEPRAHI